MEKEYDEYLKICELKLNWYEILNYFEKFSGLKNPLEDIIEVKPGNPPHGPLGAFEHFYPMAYYQQVQAFLKGFLGVELDEEDIRCMGNPYKSGFGVSSELFYGGDFKEIVKKAKFLNEKGLELGKMILEADKNPEGKRYLI